MQVSDATIDPSDAAAVALRYVGERLNPMIGDAALVTVDTTRRWRIEAAGPLSGWVFEPAGALTGRTIARYAVRRNDLTRVQPNRGVPAVGADSEWPDVAGIAKRIVDDADLLLELPVNPLLTELLRLRRRNSIGKTTAKLLLTGVPGAPGRMIAGMLGSRSKEPIELREDPFEVTVLSGSWDHPALAGGVMLPSQEVIEVLSWADDAAGRFVPEHPSSIVVGFRSELPVRDDPERATAGWERGFDENLGFEERDAVFAAFCGVGWRTVITEV